MENLTSAIVELIRRSSTDYRSEWEDVLKKAASIEEEGSSAQVALNSILENIKIARENSAPICQDTGALTFYISYPEGGIERIYTDAVNEAVKLATKNVYLRPNAVDPITGKNTENNVGVNHPVIKFHQWQKDEVQISFLQKGGGCENCGMQYRLPDTVLNAGRDLKGVRKCVIDAAVNAQGFGCAPGVFGVGIGGDRTMSYQLAKEQLFRKPGQRSDNKELAELETVLLEDINKLGIGPMGFGGKTTALEVFIASQHRHPATYYVSIAYGCWAYRNRTMVIKNDEVTYD